MRNRFSEHITTYHIHLYIWLCFITFALGFVLVKFLNAFVVLIPAIIILGLILYRHDILILFLVIYMPFEQLIFQFVPLSHLILFKLFPEIILYTVLLYVIGAKAIKKEPYSNNPLNFLLILMVIWAFISMLVNGVPIKIGVLGLRQLFRYTAVFIIISQSNFDRLFHKKLIIGIIIMAVIESLIGITQIFIGEQLIPSLFNKRASIYVGNFSIPVAGYQVITIGSRIFATMGRYDLLGYYLALGTILCLGFYVHSNYKYQRKILLIFVLIIMVALVQTFSRQSIASAVFGIGILWYFTRKKTLLITFCTIILFFIIMSTVIGTESGYYKAEDPTGNVVERIVGGFYLPQWVKFNSARAYVLFVVGRRVLEKKPFTGVGPGAIGSSVNMSFDYEEGYKMLSTQYGPARYISDVGWVSLLAQYGIVGLSIFLVIVIKLFLYAWRSYHASGDKFFKSLCASYGAYIAATVLLCFFSHPFEIRYVSFYFWLIGGVLISLGRFQGKLNTTKSEGKYYNN